MLSNYLKIRSNCFHKNKNYFPFLSILCRSIIRYLWLTVNNLHSILAL